MTKRTPWKVCAERDKDEGVRVSAWRGRGGEHKTYCSLLHSHTQVALRVDAHLVIPGTLHEDMEISGSSS